MTAGVRKWPPPAPTSSSAGIFWKAEQFFDSIDLRDVMVALTSADVPCHTAATGLSWNMFVGEWFCVDFGRWQFLYQICQNSFAQTATKHNCTLFN